MLRADLLKECSPGSLFVMIVVCQYYMDNFSNLKTKRPHLPSS